MKFQVILKKGVAIMDKRPIGVMDSGLGGLSVLRVLVQELPHEQFIFVGDQGHFPYGTRTKEDICQLALKIGRFFEQQNVKMMVVACNTATFAALPTLQAQLPFPVIGMIEPGARAALREAGQQTIGVIGTELTIKNQAYETALHKLDQHVRVISKATQPLVSVVEHGQTGTSAAQQIVNQELTIFQQQPVKTLILGCTHFPFLASEIHRDLGEDVTLIDPAQEVVKETKQWLKDHQALNNSDDAAQLTLYSTGDVKGLSAGARKWVANQQFTCHHLEL